MADDNLVSGAELGTLIDLHERQVRKLGELGVIERHAGGRYDAPAAIVAYIRHLREQAAGRAPLGAGNGLDLVSERARLAREQADRTAMANAQVRGELVPAAAVTSAVVDLIELSKARLRKVPAKVAKTDAKLRAQIEDAIAEALEDLSATRVTEKLGGAEDKEDEAGA